jgi:Gly-Xaa carboxypeptidase
LLTLLHVSADHTSIGYLSLLLAEVEKHRHAPYLTRENPFFSQLTCGAKYGSTIDKPMKHLIESAQTCDAKLAKLGDKLGEDRVQRTMVSTTQAIDLISGGVKVNALVGVYPRPLFS